MPTLAELTDTQFKHLLDDYFAPPDKRQQMNPEELRALARELNAKINVPLISETAEEKILLKIVMQIDSFLYDNLPNEIYDLVRSLDKGLDDTEASRLIARLSKLANDRLDMPCIPEAAEYVAIRFVIGVVINAARKNWNFDKARSADAGELVAVLG